jgi:hypothetical protein
MRLVPDDLCAAPGNQLQDQDGQGKNEQDMDQTAGDMETKAKRPQNKENNQDVPEHKIKGVCDLQFLDRRSSVVWMPFPELRVSCGVQSPKANCQWLTAGMPLKCELKGNSKTHEITVERRD